MRHGTKTWFLAALVGFILAVGCGPTPTEPERAGPDVEKEAERIRNEGEGRALVDSLACVLREGECP